MSETESWSFHLDLVGVPDGLSKRIAGLRPGRSDAALRALEACGDPCFAHPRLGRVLAEAVAAAAASPFSDVRSAAAAGAMRWSCCVALHDDVGSGAVDVFFAWAARRAARDQFFGTLSTLGWSNPRFVYAIDRSPVFVGFETAGGDMTGPLSPAGVKPLASDPTRGLDGVSVKLSGLPWATLAGGDDV